jgi:hypothetical protein
MDRPLLVKDLRRLSRAQEESIEDHQRNQYDILTAISALGSQEEMWQVFITHNGSSIHGTAHRSIEDAH